MHTIVREHCIDNQMGQNTYFPLDYLDEWLSVPPEQERDLNEEPVSDIEAVVRDFCTIHKIDPTKTYVHVWW